MAVVLIGADVCPIGGNTAFFKSGDAESLFHDLLPLFEDADLVVANLECPLIDSPTPIAKTGPTFGEDPACVHGIAAAGIDVLGLANNHILDHGAPGLATTLDACRKAGISTVGAGADLAEARRILVKVAGDVRIGILAMAEHEFSIATPTSPGANPLDLIDYVRNVVAHRDSFDYLIVLLHGGPEFLTVPSPRLKETCHFLIEMGAGTVVVQHPHSLGGCEHYRGGHIVYGQGALVMDEAIYRDRQSFHEGTLVALTITADGASSMQLVPFVQSDPVPGVRRMEARRSEEFLRLLEARSAAILDDDFVNREWRRFCDEHRYDYLSALLGHNRVLRVVFRTGLLTRLLYNRRRMLGTRNVVSCETHREALETLLGEGFV